MVLIRTHTDLNTTLSYTQDHQQLARIKLDDDDIGHIEEVLLEGRRIRGDVYNFERKDWAIES